jgi:hypothetical protein
MKSEGEIQGPEHKVKDLRKICYKVVEWILLALDCVQVWALDSTVIKLWFYKRTWDFMTSRANINFSKQTAV